MSYMDRFLILSVSLVPRVVTSSGLPPPAYLSIAAATPIAGGFTTVDGPVAVATLLTATKITAQGAVDLTAMFAGSRRPATIWVASYDDATQTPATAAGVLEAEQVSFGLINTESRVSADLAALAAWADADEVRQWSHPLIVQSAEAGLLTSGQPAALAALQLSTVRVHYHSDSTQPQAAREAGYVSGFPLVRGPVAGRLRQSGTLPVVTVPEAAFARANFAVLLEAEGYGASAAQRLLGMTSAYSGAGWTGAVTIVYAVQRMSAALLGVVSRYAVLGTPLFASPDGSGVAGIAASAELASMFEAGHFQPGTAGLAPNEVALPQGFQVLPSRVGTQILLDVTLLIGVEAVTLRLSVRGEEQ